MKPFSILRLWRLRTAGRPLIPKIKIKIKKQMVGFKKYVLPTKNSVHYNNWDVSNEKTFLNRLGLGTVLTGVPYKKGGVLGEIWGSTFALNGLTKIKLCN